MSEISLSDKYKDHKRIIFYELPTQHARFLIQLHYDELKQREFFRQILKGYIEGDSDIYNFIEKYKKDKKVSKRNIKIAKREKQTGNEVKNQFALDDSEMEDIFDILEQEHPEL